MAEPDPGARGGAGAKLAAIAVLWPALIAAYALAFPAQMADPYIRSDDFVSVFPTPEIYYYKTLTEGRWINWLWMLRGWPTDPVVLQWLYVGLWTLTAATAAAGLAMPRGQWLAAPLIALAVALTPQQAYIGYWFATMMPTVALTAGYALVACFASRRVAEAALFLFVPAMMMTHTAYPLLALALCAALTRGDGWRGALRLGILFALAFAAGLLAVHAINWAVHGHFGVVILGWREPNPIEGLADALANARIAANALAFAVLGVMIKPSVLTALFLAAVAGSLVVLLRAAPRAGLRMLAALAIGLGLPGLHMLLSGVEWPYRATAHVHAGIVLAMGLALVSARGWAGRGVPAVALGFTLLIALIVWKDVLTDRSPVLNRETRAVAAAVAEAASRPGPRPERIVVVGQAHALAGGDFLQFALGLTERLRLLTGLPAHVCDPQEGDFVRKPTEQPPETLALLDRLRAPETARAEAARAACAAHAQAARTLPSWPAEGAAARIGGGTIGLRLPDEIPDRPAG